MIKSVSPLSPPLAPSTTSPRAAPWAKAASATAEITETPGSSNTDVTTRDGLWATQQPWVAGQADATIPVATHTNST
jgi:hypothetical protein